MQSYMCQKNQNVRSETNKDGFADTFWSYK